MATLNFYIEVNIPFLRDESPCIGSVMLDKKALKFAIQMQRSYKKQVNK